MPDSLARLEAAIPLAAYVVKLHGEVYAPILVRLLRDREEMLRPADPMELADAVLAGYASGGRKAIRSSTSRLRLSDGPSP